ncbi:23S rRNA (uracil(1939)-C(5))-methyltransferase RlmD [Leptolyngbya cf. ectocarpi LEGE 11479]|uniref:23S rRNA (Uracil(1939)-C(5))-methyltransferase RlmD n=1 Tax=Leptolyngbya cf. ectocarpi LEGE 11479 TaxID=1828722 RepID=A0A928X3V8_LEPEC|nr:23S rRNA (uracil(1939)-C(5))-methyltransferase RlmD [Leptolyngbya ectocarpi]MBE9067266.1 23S rRNA (uracil(1939)-C(5))-methyltransferase RlmD [Leptolyngbya cf. ectocarpi LEGE 11479]
MTSLANTPRWQQGQVIELTIDDLSNSGDGVGRWQERVVFVANTVPGDRLQVRLTRIKPTYGHGKRLHLIEPSPERIRPACIVADKCGGCQWQAVAYPRQLQAKTQQVQSALERIGGFQSVPMQSIMGAPQPLGYRNKATYPLARGTGGAIKAGYYRQGTHQIVNLNQCPIQSDALDPLLVDAKAAIKARNWSLYNEKKHQGRLRYLALRVGYHTQQTLLTLVTTGYLPEIKQQAEQWLAEHPHLVGVCLNINPKQTNRVFGDETRCMAGQPYLEELFLGLRLRIQPATFFQVNTAQAEALVQVVLDQLNLQGNETVIDAYCGIGTLALPLAQRVARCIGIEVQTEAVAQARQNAALNGLQNTEFFAGAVEALLLEISAQQSSPIDVVVLDPPRKGCDRTVLETLIKIAPARIVYMSCNPATLARDLKILCGHGYILKMVQPADFFPQTAHVECVAFLEQAVF